MDLTQFFLIAPVLTLQPPFTAEALRSAHGIGVEQKKISQFNQQLSCTVGNILQSAKQGKTEYYVPHSYIENQKDMFPENAYALLFEKLQQIFPDSSVKDVIQQIPLPHFPRQQARHPGAPPPQQQFQEERGIFINWALQPSVAEGNTLS